MSKKGLKQLYRSKWDDLVSFSKKALSPSTIRCYELINGCHYRTQQLIGMNTNFIRNRFLFFECQPREIRDYALSYVHLCFVWCDAFWFSYNWIDLYRFNVFCIIEKYGPELRMRGAEMMNYCFSILALTRTCVSLWWMLVDLRSSPKIYCIILH